MAPLPFFICLLPSLLSITLIRVSASDLACDVDAVRWVPVRSDHSIKTLADEHGVAPGYILSRNPEIETPDHWNVMLAKGNWTIRLPCESQGKQQILHEESYHARHKDLS